MEKPTLEISLPHVSFMFKGEGKKEIANRASQTRDFCGVPVSRTILLTGFGEKYGGAL